MQLKSMQISEKEAQEMTSPVEARKDVPRYPYGLGIELCDETLEKLGLAALPAVGSTMTLTARVEVTSVSVNETQEGGPKKRLSLQITDMDLSSDKETPSAQKVLYGE